jgi:hypothetical protein
MQTLSGQLLFDLVDEPDQATPAPVVACCCWGRSLGRGGETMLLIAPTPIMAQRLARNLRRRGAAVHVRERQVTVLAGNVATVRAVAQRYAAVEVKR